MLRAPRPVLCGLFALTAVACGSKAPRSDAGPGDIADADAGPADAQVPADRSGPIDAVDATDSADAPEVADAPADVAPDAGMSMDASVDLDAGTDLDARPEAPTSDAGDGGGDPGDITGRWNEGSPFGYVTITSVRYLGSLNSPEGDGIYSASFYKNHPAPCSFQVVTPRCVLQHCGPAMLVNHAQAGLIYFRVSGVQKELLQYNGTANLYQTDVTVIEPWDSGGLPLEIEGSQYHDPADTANVPHFLADLTTPERIVLTAPALPDSTTTNPTPLAVPRAQALKIGWTGTSDGSLRVTVSRQTTTARDYAICRFDAAAGAAEVPPEILTLLPSGAGTILVDTAVEQIVEVDGWRLLMAGTTDAVTPSTKLPASAIDLQ
jgi:hypothetical protein